jgi:hypothetical protein
LAIQKVAFFRRCGHRWQKRVFRPCEHSAKTRIPTMYFSERSSNLSLKIQYTVGYGKVTPGITPVRR